MLTNFSMTRWAAHTEEEVL